MDGVSNLGLCVRRLDTDALVGFIEITQIVRGSFSSAYLGYYAFSPHAGQGFMKDGLQQAVRLAFNRLGLHRLEANIQPENFASIQLVKACGFAKEGYSPRYLKIAGRWRDHERWTILAEEWLAAHDRVRIRDPAECRGHAHLLGEPQPRDVGVDRDLLLRAGGDDVDPAFERCLRALETVPGDQIGRAHV